MKSLLAWADEAAKRSEVYPVRFRALFSFAEDVCVEGSGAHDGRANAIQALREGAAFLWALAETLTHEAHEAELNRIEARDSPHFSTSGS